MEKSSARPGIVSRKKRFLRTVLFLIVLLIVLLSLSVALLSVNMRPAMAALAIARIRSVAARAMNDAILESMGDETNYARLIQVHESTDGRSGHFHPHRYNHGDFVPRRQGSQPKGHIQSCGQRAKRVQLRIRLLGH